MENSWCRLEPKKTQMIMKGKDEHSNQKLFLAPFIEGRQSSFSKKRQISTACIHLGCPSRRCFSKQSLSAFPCRETHLAQERLGGGRQALFLSRYINCNYCIKLKILFQNVTRKKQKHKPSKTNTLLPCTFPNSS